MHVNLENCNENQLILPQSVSSCPEMQSGTPLQIEETSKHLEKEFQKWFKDTMHG